MFEGYVFPVGRWNKLTKKERDIMKQRYSKLKMIGRRIEHYHQRKVGKEITLVFSSTNLFKLCKDVDWAIQYSPNFLQRAQSDDKAVPEGFVLIPDLGISGLSYLVDLFMLGDIEVRAFFRHGTMYQATIMRDGQLFMEKIW